MSKSPNYMNVLAQEVSAQKQIFPEGSFQRETMDAFQSMFAREAAKEAEPVVRCPKCQSEDVGQRKASGAWHGDVTWMQCDECQNQWGHS